MAHLRITIDDAVVILGQWSTEPPFISEQHLAIANRTDQPWSIHSGAHREGHHTTIQDTELTVQTRETGWTLTVKHSSAV